MIKIKVIDLLVKIANGEEVPKKIIYKGKVREFDYEDKDYTCISDTDYYLFHDTLTEGTGDKMVTGLNDEVEIIEDKPKEDKKIEKLNIEIQDERTGNAYIKNEYGTKCYLTKHSKIIANKINEIIDKINGE